MILDRRRVCVVQTLRMTFLIFILLVSGVNLETGGSMGKQDAFLIQRAPCWVIWSYKVKVA